MLKLGRLLPDLSDPNNRQIHFLTSYVWRIEDVSSTLFILLMCAAFFIQIYGSQSSVGTFVEGAALRSDLQYDRLRSSGG